MAQNAEAFLSIGRRLLGRRLFDRLFKATAYAHFVAGADLAEIRPAVQRLERHGVKSILDYSVEADVQTTPHEHEGWFCFSNIEKNLLVFRRVYNNIYATYYK